MGWGTTGATSGMAPASTPGSVPPGIEGAAPPGARTDVFEGDALHLDLAHAAGDAQPVCRGIAEVDHPLTVERPAVIDAHDDLPARRHMPDAGIAGNGQRAVRGREAVDAVELAAG